MMDIVGRQWEESRTISDDGKRVTVTREIHGVCESPQEVATRILAAAEGLTDPHVNVSVQWDSGILEVTGTVEPTDADHARWRDDRRRFAARAKARYDALMAQIAEEESI